MNVSVTDTAGRARGARLCGVLAAAAVMLLGLTWGMVAAEAQPLATIVVSDLGDATGACAASGTGTCSLRDAVTYANHHAGADSITFSASGVVTLASALVISDDLTIDGSGQNISILGNSPALSVMGGSRVTLNALVFAGGGQAIVNSGILTLTQTSVNHGFYVVGYTGKGGGIYNAGSLTLIRSDVSQNELQDGRGGGIYNDQGSVTISNSTFYGNVARFFHDYNDGGAIYNDHGTLAIDNSTFSGNTSQYRGGAIYNEFGNVTIRGSTLGGNSAENGGGIFNNAGDVTVSNSTFSANSATLDNGGGINNNGTLTVTNSTFSGNSATDGGALSNNGAVTLRNTILANSSHSNCFGSGTFSADAYNLATDAACANATQKTSGQLNLDTLGNNGGSTQTFALLPGSAAIDSGDDSACTAADQRGYPRPQRAHCDIGAFEALIGVTNDSPTVLGNTTTFTAGIQNTPLVTLTWDFGDSSPAAGGNLATHSYGAGGDYLATLTATNAWLVYTTTTAVIVCDQSANTVLNANNDMAGSLRRAVLCAAPGAGIGFDPALANQTIALTNGAIAIDKALTIDGSGAPGVRISGNQASRVFTTSAAVSLKSLIVQNGVSAINENGGGIDAAGALSLSHVSFFSNTSGYYGGGLYAESTLSVSDSQFSDNSATLDGGGIFAQAGMNMTGTQFISNSAPGNGGGIFAYGAMNITGTQFISNSANGGGGGLYAAGALNLSRSQFTGNRSLSNGGGLLASYPTTVTASQFISNSSQSDGGGLYSEDILSVSGSQFTGNTAQGAGGGLYTYGAATASRNTFSGNSAGQGGGIYTYADPLAVSSSTLSGNHASLGGGGMDNFNGQVTVTNTTFSGNTGGSGGGGVHNDSTLTIGNSTFSGNSATAGGGISNTGTLTLRNSIVAGSTSGGDCANIGTLTANSHNLADDATCAGAAPKTLAQLKLGPLANNGGATETFPLLAGSAAIDAGDDGVCPATDQRGVARPQGLHCDAGAYEYQGAFKTYLPLTRR